jgi:hypothetical protein
MRRLHSGKITGAESVSLDHETVQRITGSVREMIQHHVDTNPAFKEALRREAIDRIRAGDLVTGQALLRNHFHETETAEATPVAGTET